MALDSPVVLDLQAVQSPTFRERGVARYALDFTRAVIRHAPGAIDQIIVRSDGSDHDGLRASLGTDIVTSTPTWDMTGGVFHALSPFDIDIPVSAAWPRAASHRAMRMIVTVYDIIPELFPEMYLIDPGTRRRYRARREFIRAADHVMTLSQSCADDLVDHLGVADDRITVVGAACSDVFGPTGDRAAAARQARALIPGLGPSAVVYNGAVEPRKNMERLIDAFSRMPEEFRTGRQLVLVCHLDDLQRNHLDLLAASLGVGGQLLLTGKISDDALVSLYQSADLVVFPSFYEGYGLPVAEAMACGAPVVASANSSLLELVSPDATFDPCDADAIAATMRRALTDDRFRAALVAWSERPRPGWETVGRRAAEVYRRVGAVRSGPSSVAPSSPGTSVATPGRAPWRRRPLVALLTPLPPESGGVAQYSSRLATAMSELVDVELFVDGDHPDRAQPPSGLPWHRAKVLPKIDALRGGFDAVIACVGNSEHHGWALRLLRRGDIRATVLAHDVRMTDLYRHGEARDAVPEGYAHVLGQMYPDATSDWIVDGWVQPQDAEARGVYMAKELIGLSERFLVTSESAADLARAEARPEDRRKVGVSRFAYPPPRRRQPTEVSPGCICTFGVVNRVKQPELLLEAFAMVHRDDPETSLVFVGPADPAERRQLESAAADLGLHGVVTFTGAVDDATYQYWLRAAAVAVQLRAGSNGETSAAVADCIANGIPTIVSAIGASGALPEFVTKVPTAATPSALAGTLRMLLADASRRAAATEAGLQFAGERSIETTARQLVTLALQPPWVDELVVSSLAHDLVVAS